MWTSLAFELDQEEEEKYKDADQLEEIQQREKNKRLESNIMTATDPDPPTFKPTSVHETTEQPKTDESTSSSNKVLPQAILVYHESAHSIVFRDHLRRQQGAIRRTSSVMEQQNNVRRASHAAASAAAARTTSQSPSRATSTIVEISETEEAGYESSGSQSSKNSIAAAYNSGDDINSSVTSGGSSRSSQKKILRKAKSSLHAPLRKLNSPSHTPPPPPSFAPSPPPPSSISSVAVANFQPVIEPLDELEFNAKHVFDPLLDADPFQDELDLTNAECEVVELLKLEKAVVKTIRNQDWTSFLNKFKPEGGEGKGKPLPAPWEQRTKGDAKGDSGERYPFNSFVTSTTLLPSCSKKMRCFGSTNEYATGAVFALPSSFPNDTSEDDAAKRTRTWSWPSGYSAKTEFNIDHRGNLINGREEALVPLSRMREMNHSYLHDTDYVVGGRMVKGGLQVSEKGNMGCLVQLLFLSNKHSFLTSYMMYALVIYRRSLTMKSIFALEDQVAFPMVLMFLQMINVSILMAQDDRSMMV